MQIVLYLVMLVVFFGVMIAVGFVCRRKSRTSQGFMLGGRSVGPWLTAFAYGTSYFSAVVFVRRLVDVDRARQRAFRLPSCVGGAGKKDARHDAAS